MVRKFRILIIVLGVLAGSISYAQLADPGGDGSAPSDGGIAGGGAPIDGGLSIVIGLSIAYLSRRTYIGFINGDTDNDA